MTNFQNFNSIQTFKDNFKGGTRANRFNVSAVWPTGLGIDPADALKKTTFKISATSFPNSKMQTTQLFYRGRPIIYATDRIYGVWSVVVFDDSDNNTLWNLFHKWIEKIDGHQTHLYSDAPDFDYSSYQTTFTLNQHGLNGTAAGIEGTTGIRTVILKNVWPLSVGPIEFEMGDGNLVSFKVDLKFDYLTFGEGNIDNSLT